MKNIFLAFVCLLSLAVSRSATAEGYIDPGKLKFDTKYRWNSGAVSLALLSTTFPVDRFIFWEKHSSVQEYKSYNSNFSGLNGLFLFDWISKHVDRALDGMNEEGQKRVLKAYDSLLDYFDDAKWNFSTHEAYRECVKKFKKAEIIKGNDVDVVKNYCSSFVTNMLTIHNSMVGKDIDIKKGGVVAACQDLLAFSMGYPVVCGGICHAMPGTNDLLALYYNGEHKVHSQEFDDLCDGTWFRTEYWYVFCNSTEYKKYDTKEKALENINAGCGNVK